MGRVRRGPHPAFDWSLEEAIARAEELFQEARAEGAAEPNAVSSDDHQRLHLEFAVLQEAVEAGARMRIVFFVRALELRLSEIRARR